MGSRFDEIARRKKFLIERCARDREELAACFRQVCLPFNLGAFLLMIGKTLRAYPVTAAGLSSLIVTGFGAKLMRAAGKLIAVTRVIRPLWSWWSKRRRSA
jgi:hypothetical protein